MGELLCVSQVCAGYGKREILHGVSFTVKKGELCALLGTNGSGKSTLLRAVCGLLSYRGSCILDGEQLRTMPQRERTRQMAYLAQWGGTALSLSALDVVLMGYNPVLGVLQKPNARQRSHALEVMGRLQVQQCAQQDFLSLSEGQRQLVLFARTLVRSPKLLVLDEPDSALDYSNRHRVLRLLKEYAVGEGAGILLCSHDANFALQYADRLLLLKNGALQHNVVPAAVEQSALCAALGDIYGPVEVLRHNGAYLMTGGTRP